MEAHDTVIALDNYTYTMVWERFSLNWLLHENGRLVNAFEILGVTAGMEEIQSELNSVSNHLLIELYPFLVVNGHPPIAGGEIETMEEIAQGILELATMLSSILVRLTFFMLEREELIEPFDQFIMFVKILLADIEDYRNSGVLNRVDHLLEVCRAKFFEKKANRMLQGIMPAQRINEYTPFSDNDKNQVLTHLLRDIVEEIIRLTSICLISDKRHLSMRHEVCYFVKRRVEECHSALREIGEEKLSQDLRFVFAYQVDDEYRRAIEFLNEMTLETISTLWGDMGTIYFHNGTGF